MKRARTETVSPTWICTGCTFKNHSFLKQCELCHAPKPALQALDLREPALKPKKLLRGRSVMLIAAITIVVATVTAAAVYFGSTQKKTEEPTQMPTMMPTRLPTQQPTRLPTQQPTRLPTRLPTQQPTRQPTRVRKTEKEVLDLFVFGTIPGTIDIRRTSIEVRDLFEDDVSSTRSFTRRYETNLEEVARDLATNTSHVERWLWHATQTDKLKSVLSKGFDRKYSWRALWGKGNYFARDSGYSSNPLFCGYNPPYSSNPDSGVWVGQMLLVRVIVGESHIGNRLYDGFPEKPGGRGHYETLVDNMANPTIFVSWKDHYAVPAYLVTFNRYDWPDCI